MACLIPKMADYGGDQRKSKSVQDWKRKQRQSGSEGIKKIKGEDAEQRRAKQRQHMANLRARETGKKRYQQVISIIGSLLSVNNSSSPFITGKRDSRTSDNGPRTDSAVKPMSKGPTVLMIWLHGGLGCVNVHVGVSMDTKLVNITTMPNCLAS